MRSSISMLGMRTSIVYWDLQQYILVDISIKLCVYVLLSFYFFVFCFFLFCIGATIKFIAMYMLGMFVPYLYMLYLSWTVFEMFTPVMGRSGSEIPPDMVLAGFIVIFTVILSSYFVSRICKCCLKPLRFSIV